MNRPVLTLCGAIAFCVVGAVALAGLWVLYTVLFSLGLGCIGDAAGCAMK